MSDRKPKGTRIIIRAEGRVMPGVVKTAVNYGGEPVYPNRLDVAGNLVTEPDNWYIEFTHTGPARPGYLGDDGYWKQREDGGTIEFLD